MSNLPGASDLEVTDVNERGWNHEEAGAENGTSIAVIPVSNYESATKEIVVMDSLGRDKGIPAEIPTIAPPVVPEIVCGVEEGCTIEEIPKDVPSAEIVCDADEGCKIDLPEAEARKISEQNRKPRRSSVVAEMMPHMTPTKLHEVRYQSLFWINTLIVLFKDYLKSARRTAVPCVFVSIFFCIMLRNLAYAEDTIVRDLGPLGVSFLYFWIFVIPWEWLTVYTQIAQADALKAADEPRMSVPRFVLGIVLPSGGALALSLYVFCVTADVGDLASYVWSFPIHYTIYLIVRITTKALYADRKPFNTKTVLVALVEAIVSSIIYCFSDMMFCLFFYADAAMIDKWNGWGAILVCFCYALYMYLFTCLYHLVLIPASLRAFKNLPANDKRSLQVMSAYSTAIFFGLPEVLLSYTCPKMEIFLIGALIVEVSAYFTKQTILKGNEGGDEDKFQVVDEEGGEYGASLGKLEIVSQAAFHLPKMDTIGSCDPYLRLKLGPRQFKTSVKMRQIDATWTEHMEFNLLTDASGECADLHLTVMDRDRGGARDDTVGTYKVEGRVLMKIPPGRAVQTIWMEVIGPQGDKRIGMDKEPTLVRLEVRRWEPTEDEGLGQAVVQSLAVRNLPKVDRFGLCDPFLVLQMADTGSAEHATGVKKRKLNAKWTERIVVELGEGPAQRRNPLHIRCMDWERTAEPRLVGQCEISLQELLEAPRTVDAHKAPLVLRKNLGKPSKTGGLLLVTGQDGEPCEVVLELQRFEPEGKAPEVKAKLHGSPMPAGIRSAPSAGLPEMKAPEGVKEVDLEAGEAQKGSGGGEGEAEGEGGEGRGLKRALTRTLKKGLSRRFHIAPEDHFVSYEDVVDAVGEGVENAMAGTGTRATGPGLWRLESWKTDEISGANRPSGSPVPPTGMAKSQSFKVKKAASKKELTRGQSLRRAMSFKGGEQGGAQTRSVSVEHIQSRTDTVDEKTGEAVAEVEVSKAKVKLSPKEVMASKRDMLAGAGLAQVGAHMFAVMMLILVWIFSEKGLAEFQGLITWDTVLIRFAICIGMMSISDALQEPAIEKRFPDMANEKERQAAMNSLKPVDWATAVFFIACVGSMFAFGYLAAVQ